MLWIYSKFVKRPKFPLFTPQHKAQLINFQSDNLHKVILKNNNRGSCSSPIQYWLIRSFPNKYNATCYTFMNIKEFFEELFSLLLQERSKNRCLYWLLSVFSAFDLPEIQIRDLAFIISLFLYFITFSVTHEAVVKFKSCQVNFTDRDHWNFTFWYIKYLKSRRVCIYKIGKC